MEGTGSDSSGSRFTMHGSRAAINLGLSHIEEQVEAIEKAIDEEPGFVFDLARTIIESTCKTILKENGIDYKDNESLTTLLGRVNDHLPLLPESASQETGIRNSITRILSGLGNAVHGMCELRNQCSFASHGYGKPRPSLDLAHALVVAEAADAIVGFLYRMHSLGKESSVTQELKYEDHASFNDFLDDEFGSVKIYEMEFYASKILFEMDPQSYKNYLLEYEANICDSTIEENVASDD